MITRIAPMICVLGLAAPLVAQEPTAPSEDAPAAVVEEIQPAAEVVLTVEVHSDEPIAVVELVTIRPGQGAVGSREGQLGSDGHARFTVAPDPELQYLARVTTEDEFAFPADHPMTVPGNLQATVHVLPRRSDPTGIIAERIVTLVGVFEGYLTYEQVWLLRTDGSYIYVPPEDEEEGLPIPMPEGVEGIHVLRPRRGAMATDDSVILRSAIGPANAQVREGADLYVRFSLPNTSASHTFEQDIPMPVDAAFVFVPMTTPLPDAPNLDIELEVPTCSSGIDEDVICFETLGGEPPAWDPYLETDRAIAQDGRGRAATNRLTFRTSGWPAPEYPVRMGVIAGTAAVAFLLLGLWRRFGSREQGLIPEDVLQARRHALVRELRLVHSEYQAGRLPESEHGLQALVISHKLERIYERLGLTPDLELEDGAEAPA